MDNTKHAILHLFIISAFVFSFSESHITASPDNMVQDETTAEPWNYYGSEYTSGMDGSTDSYRTTAAPYTPTTAAPYPTSFRPTTAVNYPTTFTPTTSTASHYYTGYHYPTTSHNQYPLNKTKSYNYTTTPYPYRPPYPYPTPYLPYTTSYPYMRTPYHYQPTPTYYNPYYTNSYIRPTPAIDPYATHPYGRAANPFIVSPPKPSTNFITQNFNAPIVYKICVNCTFQNYGHSEDKIDFGKKNETEGSIEYFGRKNDTEESHEYPQNSEYRRGYNDHVW